MNRPKKLRSAAHHSTIRVVARFRKYLGYVVAAAVPFVCVRLGVIVARAARTARPRRSEPVGCHQLSIPISTAVGTCRPARSIVRCCQRLLRDVQVNKNNHILLPLHKLTRTHTNHYKKKLKKGGKREGRPESRSTDETTKCKPNIAVHITYN